MMDLFGDALHADSNWPLELMGVDLFMEIFIIGPKSRINGIRHSWPKIASDDARTDENEFI